MKLYYDLHIHSCLSPCADDDNTPNNIIGMGVLNGLDVMALTDHNTCRNCPAFFAAAEKNGIVAIAGMELTTAEDIHIIFLFDSLENAMLFDGEINKRRILIKNRTDIYGRQLILDKDDNPVDEDEYLLSNATTVTVEECPALAKRFSGICYPAHIDRQANGIIAVLGTMPDINGFNTVEFNSITNIEDYTKKYNLKKYKTVVNSDAHYLWDIKEKQDFFEIDKEPDSPEKIRQHIVSFLGGVI